MLNNFAPDRDIVTMPGPVHDLDHGSYNVAYGTKIGIDATRKDASEGYTREWPPEMVMSDDVRRRVANGGASTDGPAWTVRNVRRWSGQGAAALRRRSATRRSSPMKVASFSKNSESNIRCSRCRSRTRCDRRRARRYRRGPHYMDHAGGVGSTNRRHGDQSILDRDIDARNPRTARRALASGKFRRHRCCGQPLPGWRCCVWSAWMLNPLCVKLLPIAAVLLLAYPLCKRFTWTTHFVLGAVDGLAPLGAYVAIAGGIGIPGVLLFVAVTFWVAGFDIIYALMDLGVDREQGIASVPARFGERAATLPLALHGAMAVGLGRPDGLRTPLGRIMPAS